MNDHKEGKLPEAHEEPVAWMVYIQIGDDECVTYGSTKYGVSIVARDRYGHIKNAIFSNPIPLYTHPVKEEIQMKVSDEDYSVLASRILEEHKKYSDRFLLNTWADVAARKVVSDLREMGYMNSDPKEKQVTTGLTVDKVMEVVEEFVKEEVEKGPDGALWNSGYSHEWIDLIVGLRPRMEQAAKQL